MIVVDKSWHGEHRLDSSPGDNWSLSSVSGLLMLTGVLALLAGLFRAVPGVCSLPAVLCLLIDCWGAGPSKRSGAPAIGVNWNLLLAAVSLDAAGVLSMLLQGRSGTPSTAEPNEALLLRLV